jgi:hypothetical protein
MTRYNPSPVELAFRSHCRIFERIWVNGDSEGVFDSSDKQRFACKAGEKIARKIGSVDVESYNFVVLDARLNCDAIEEQKIFENCCINFLDRQKNNFLNSTHLL